MLCTCMASGALAQQAQVKEWKIDSLAQYISAKKTGILIINFWATFCKPCVKEIPHFIEFAKKNPEADLLFVSLDMQEEFPDGIAKWQTKLQMPPSVWLNETNADYFMPQIEASWSGAIPATLIINRATGKRFFTESDLSYEELVAAYNKVQH